MADLTPEQMNAQANPVSVASPHGDGAGRGQLMMGLVAMGGMIGMSAVAVAVVFVLSSNANKASGPNVTASPVINVNASPDTSHHDNHRADAGRPNAHHTRHSANHQVQALPGQLATPTAVVGKREIVFNRADPAPPPYAKPSDLNPKVKFLRRRSPTQPGGMQMPLPNRLSPAGQAGKQATTMSADLHQISGVLAVPGYEPPGSVFTSSPVRNLEADSGEAGGVKVVVSRAMYTSGAIKPYGLRPLDGHELLMASIKITNDTGDAIMLSENSVWAEEVSDPDGGYYQNHFAVGEVFPREIKAGESLAFTTAIPFIGKQAPTVLVVQADGQKRVALPLTAK